MRNKTIGERKREIRLSLNDENKKRKMDKIRTKIALLSFIFPVISGLSLVLGFFLSISISIIRFKSMADVLAEIQARVIQNQ